MQNESTQNGSALSVHENAKEYYGKVLETNNDLQSSACCSTEDVPGHVKEVLSQIHAEIHQKFYGCGSPIPEAVQGVTVLDLGCGVGRDCFVLSKLVGAEGRVIGVDMTVEQLEVANKHIDFHMKQFGFSEPNIEFHNGVIEDLSTIPIADNSVDIVTSNCVINLSPNKEKVFTEIFRVLKPGGELYFSDVFADRRIDAELMKDPVLHGECLSGALYREDFRRMMSSFGCPDYRNVSTRKLSLDSLEVAAKIGFVGFTSETVRLFKLDDLEDQCEDFGQVAYYLGTIPECPHAFALDDHHLFESHRPMAVCGNTASMIQNTRFAKHFRVEGDRKRHFGLFPCGPTPVEVASMVSARSGSCC